MPRTTAKGAPNLPDHPWAFIKYFLKYVGFTVSIMAICEIGQKFCQIYIPYTFKEIIDGAIAYKGAPEGILTALESPVTTFVLISIGTILFARTSGALLIYVGPKLRRQVRNSLYHYMQHHSHKYFTSNFSGSLANRINEVAMAVNHGLWVVMFDFLPVTISFSVSIYLLYTAHYTLALYLGIWVAIYILVSYFLARGCQKYAREFAAMRSKTTGQIVDAVTNVMNTKLFARMDYERTRLDGQLISEVKVARRTIWFMEKMRWFQFTAALILQVGMIIFAINLFGKGLISVGNFAFVASLGLIVIEDARGLSRRFLEFFEYFGNITDGVRILAGSHEVVDNSTANTLQISKGAIDFRDVDFHYNDGTPIFEKLNLSIKGGEKVGLVGVSGSGKSTFANLILRLFDVKGGDIFIDDQPISGVTQDSLRENISMIPQEPMLFHRSLLENIRYGKTDSTDDQIFEAAKKASAHEFILNVPEQYDALVGERGIKLSGGQRQRVAIARAILKDAPILILDEATSSLDSATEKAIQNTLEFEMKGKTVIVIAHRLSTIAHMDRIIVFRHGKIVEQGTHDELLDQNGHYALLWNMQAGGFLPESLDEIVAESTRPPVHQ